MASALDVLIGSEKPGQDGKVAPHVFTFASVLNSAYKTYSFRYDEALKHMPSNALAMRRDAYLKSLINERKFPTARRTWQLEVDSPKDARQKEVLEGLTRMVKGVKKFNRMRLYLLEAIWYGRYGAQGEWRRRADLGDLWTFCNHQPVNGDKLQYTWSDVPCVMVNSTGPYSGSELIYGDRAPLLKLERPEYRRQFVIHTHEVDDADYFEGEMAGSVDGIGVRSQIYWAWWLRDELLAWAMDFMQKVGTLGLLIFWYEDGNKAAKAQAEQNARDMSTKTALTMPVSPGTGPQKFGVQHIPASTGGIDTLRTMISDYFERHMERLIIGQTLSGSSEGAGLGGSSVAKFHQDTKYQLIAFDSENLDETLTDDLIEVGKQLNYPWADFPVRFKSNVPDPENAEKLEAVTKVWEKIDFKVDEVRGLTGMSRPNEGDETVGGVSQTVPGNPLFGGLIPAATQEGGTAIADH